MLILSRKQGQAIVLPDCDVVVTVMRVGEERVKLGIQAPQEVAIHREELLKKTHAFDSCAPLPPVQRPARLGGKKRR